MFCLAKDRIGVYSIFSIAGTTVRVAGLDAVFGGGTLGVLYQQGRCAVAVCVLEECLNREDRVGGVPTFIGPPTLVVFSPLRCCSCGGRHGVERYPG